MQKVEAQKVFQKINWNKFLLSFPLLKGEGKRRPSTPAKDKMKKFSWGHQYLRLKLKIELKNKI